MKDVCNLGCIFIKLINGGILWKIRLQLYINLNMEPQNVMLDGSIKARWQIYMKYQILGGKI